MGAGPAVLVMAPPEPGEALVSLLGSENAGALRSMLATRARSWARELIPDAAVHSAGSGESLSAAAARAFADGGGPLLVVWPLLFQLGAEHGMGALDDLRSGCDVVLGPVIDGGLYLLGLAHPVPELLSLPDERWQDPDVMTLGFTAARDAGLEVGILRAERALRSPADVHAALADPLLPEEIRAVLAPATPRH